MSNKRDETLTELCKKLEEFLVDKSEEWVYTNLYKITDKLEEVNQKEDTPDYPYNCKRVIRVRAFTNRDILQKFGYEPVLLNGVYVVTDGIIIPENITSRMKKSKFIIPENVIHELPEGYDYGSLRLISKGRSFAIKKGYLTDIVKYSSQWEYLDLY